MTEQIQFDLTAKRENCYTQGCQSIGLYIPVLVFRGPWCTVHCESKSHVCTVHDIHFQLDQVFCNECKHRIPLKAVLTDSVWDWCTSRIVVVTRGIKPTRHDTLLTWETTGGLPVANVPIVEGSNVKI